MVVTPVIVASIEEEDAVLGTCECGGSWRLASEDVVPVRDRWYDAVIMQCDACSGVNRRLFDITSFFAPRGRAWSRT
jgi:hypothetical protein